MASISVKVLIFLCCLCMSLNCVTGNKNKSVLTNSTTTTAKAKKDKEDNTLPTVISKQELKDAQRISRADAPYHADIRTSRRSCGGSIITPAMIITAAHCVTQRGDDYAPREDEEYAPDKPMEVKDITVYIGSDSAARGKAYRVKQIFIHYSYLTYTKSLSRDLGIIGLEKEIPFTDTSKPIVYPKYRESDTVTFFISSGRICTVAGFDKNNQLIRIELQLMDTIQCQDKTHSGFYPEALVVCGTNNYTRGVCKENFGSGLVCDNWIVGVVAYQKTCSRSKYAEYPVVCPRLDRHNGFIMEAKNEFENVKNTSMLTNVCLYLVFTSYFLAITAWESSR